MHVFPILAIIVFYFPSGLCLTMAQEGPDTAGARGQPPAYRRAKLWGYLAGTGCVVSIPLSATFITLLGRQIPDFELNLFRSLFEFVLGCIVVKAWRLPLHISKSSHIYVGLMSITYVASDVAFYGAMSMLPVSEVNVEFVVVQMVFIALLSFVIFRKPIEPADGISLVICTFGILLISQPQWIFGTHSDTSYNSSRKVNTSIQLDSFSVHKECTGNISATVMIPEESAQSTRVLFNTSIGYLLLVVAGFCESIYFLAAGNVPDVNPMVLVVWGSVFSIFASVVLSVYFEQWAFPRNLSQAGILLGHCLFAALDLIGINFGCKLIGPMKTALLHTLETPALLIPQFLLNSAILPRRNPYMEVVGVILSTLGVALIPALDFLREVSGSQEI